MTQLVKNPPAIQETQVQFLGGEDSLEKGMVTHANTLVGELHGWRSLADNSLWGHKGSDTAEPLTLSLKCYHKYPNAEEDWHRRGRGSVTVAAETGII